MNFVWTYIKGPSYFNKVGLFNELEYSIKSVKKNFRGEARCIVVGDDPGLDVEFVPVPRVETHVSGRPGEIDQVKKFQAVFPIVDEFILMYDDIYFLNPVSEADLRVTYAYNEFDDFMKYRRKWGGSYKWAWRDTYRIIEERILPGNRWDYECHLPKYIESDRMDWVINQPYSIGGKIVTPQTWGLISTSLYTAYYGGVPIVMTKEQYDLVIWPPEIPLEEGFKRKFLNLMDPGITPEFIDKMEEVFGESTSVKPPHRRR